MKQLAILSFAVSLSLVSATVVAAQCWLDGFTQLPSNSPVALGPLLYSIVVQYPDVGNALVGGRDAWNVTDAAGRIGGYGGTTLSDCPMGQRMQIGAYNFYSDYCPTAQAYGYNIPPPPPNVTLAFVDYFFWHCPGCGTKSISLNTAVPWAITPGVGQFDIQSVVAHEFGHVLGSGHMRGTILFCDDQNDGPTCAQDPNRNTMQRNTPGGVGETCARTVNGYDKYNADYLY